MPFNGVNLTYDDLANELQIYNQNYSDEFTEAAIPYAILQGQQRIWRELKDIGFEHSTTEGTFITDNAVIAKPANWNKTISFTYGSVNSVFQNTTTLYLRTYEFCRSYWPNITSDPENPPLFYADHGALNDPATNPYSRYFISPTPDRNYKYQIVYLQRPDNITIANPTNILTERFPDLLFYACNLEALSYLKNDERIPVFESLYNRALQSANQQTQERYSDRTSKRDKD